MAKRKLPLGRVYGLIEPGPVVLLTTARRGRANVMAMSWHTMMEFEPPLIGCVVSGRNHSFAALRATRECVLNIPGVELAKAVVGCGNCSARDERIDKFARFGLSPVAAAEVDAPLIDECMAALECRVVDTRFVPRYNFFVLEVVRAWIDPAKKNAATIHHRGHGRFAASGPVFKLASHMK